MPSWLGVVHGLTGSLSRTSCRDPFLVRIDPRSALVVESRLVAHDLPLRKRLTTSLSGGQFTKNTHTCFDSLG